MPRAKRTYLPGYIWHLTQRCHDRQFLLKYKQDKKNWLFWIGRASQKYRMTILNYMVTSNHIHLIVWDDGKPGTIAKCMHMASGMTAQQHNSRKQRHGAFWEDRYHATAVDSDVHLVRCMFYVDLNMVRAGTVNHPKDWLHCGFREIVGHRHRYRLIERTKLSLLLGIAPDSLAEKYGDWIENYMKEPHLRRESCWTESLAVGRKGFLQEFKDRLGPKAKYRALENAGESFELKEDQAAWD